jgi:hypothetical protein
MLASANLEDRVAPLSSSLWPKTPAGSPCGEHNGTKDYGNDSYILPGDNLTHDSLGDCPHVTALSARNRRSVMTEMPRTKRNRPSCKIDSRCTAGVQTNREKRARLYSQDLMARIRIGGLSHRGALSLIASARSFASARQRRTLELHLTDVAVPLRPPGSIARAGKRQFHAPVLFPTVRRVVRGHRVCLTETLCRHQAWVNSL